MPTIETKTGSATSPQPSNDKGILIAHLCNDLGVWGAGFVLAVSDLSMAPETAYKAWANEYNRAIPRGLIQIVEAKPNIFVANMIAQFGTMPHPPSCECGECDGCLVDYLALTHCLQTMFIRAIQLDCDVHIPAGMGSGLAGGDKDTIHAMIENAARIAESKYTVNPYNINVTLWEFLDTTALSFVPDSF